MKTRTKAHAPVIEMARTPLKIVAAITLTLIVGACTMSETGQRVGTGAAIGALGGAILGGNTEGALIGAAVGAGGGYVVDQQKKREQSDDETARLRQENERLKREAEYQ